MKLKKFEICMIAVTLALASFGFGYFVGQGRERHVINVEPVYHEETADRIAVLPVIDKDDNEDKVAAEDGLIDINKADKELLCTLDGIGEVLADRIIEYREDIGGFSDIEELMDVYGLGEKIFDRIKDSVTIR